MKKKIKIKTTFIYIFLLLILLTLIIAPVFIIRQNTIHYTNLAESTQVEATDLADYKNESSYKFDKLKLMRDFYRDDPNIIIIEKESDGNSELIYKEIQEEIQTLQNLKIMPNISISYEENREKFNYDISTFIDKTNFATIKFIQGNLKTDEIYLMFLYDMNEKKITECLLYSEEDNFTIDEENLKNALSLYYSYQITEMSIESNEHYKKVSFTISDDYYISYVKSKNYCEFFFENKK